MAQFEEIAHSGGKLAISVVTDSDDQKSIRLHYVASRPVRSELIGVYALMPGVVIENLSLGGMGTPWPPPQFEGSIPVLICSDSEGRFGHNCPKCTRYWRSGPHPSNCPYCGLEADSIYFLSTAQLRYVRLFCETWEAALLSDDGSEHVIDLDEMADATLGLVQKPEFYISDQRQQTLLECPECGEFNDILGRFGHCSVCYTRNDYRVISEEIIPDIRSDLKSGRAPYKCLQAAVSSLEVFVKQYCSRLQADVPMIPKRRDRLSKQNFRNWETIDQLFVDLFGIEIRSKFEEEAWAKCERLVLRRHVYEHNGGVVDEDYLRRSGDASVLLGESISESESDVHEFLSVVEKFAEVVHGGYHKIFPPKIEIITRYKERQRKSMA